MNSIRVMLVEDHVIVREGLKMLLSSEPGIKVVAEAGDAREALEKANESEPDVILMDIALPGVDGIEASVEIKQRHPGIHIVMLTMHVDEQLVARSVQAGTSGYLLKSASREQVITTIRAVHQGQVFLPSDQTRILVGMVNGCQLAHNITAREKEILLILKQGLANKEIACRLCVSESTVKTHLHSLYAKLGVKTRTEAVTKAIKEGLLN